MGLLYLDNAATSFPKPPQVAKRVYEFICFLGGNSGRGNNQLSRKSTEILDDTRRKMARLFNIEAYERIAFTPNITYAINLALYGFLEPGDHVITSSMEHNAVARPLYALSAQGIEWTRVPCETDGSLDPEVLQRNIRPNTRLICILHASNVTGTIMPIREVGRIAAQHGILFMLDTAQTAGIIPIDVVKDGIDILTFTGHKGLLGPQGTGGIYIKPGLEIKPLIRGGTGSFSESLLQPEFMPDVLESGTMNMPGLIGLNAGIDFILAKGVDNIRKHEQRLGQALIDGLREIEGVHLYGPGDLNRQTAVISFNLAGLDCGDLALWLEEGYGIISRAGLHCAALAHDTIGTGKEGCCRLSPGLFNTGEDIQYVIESVWAISRQRR